MVFKTLLAKSVVFCGISACAIALYSAPLAHAAPEDAPGQEVHSAPEEAPKAADAELTDPAPNPVPLSEREEQYRELRGELLNMRMEMDATFEQMQRLGLILSTKILSNWDLMGEYGARATGEVVLLWQNRIAALKADFRELSEKNKELEQVVKYKRAELINDGSKIGEEEERYEFRAYLDSEPKELHEKISSAENNIGRSRGLPAQIVAKRRGKRQAIADIREIAHTVRGLFGADILGFAREAERGEDADGEELAAAMKRVIELRKMREDAIQAIEASVYSCKLENLTDDRVAEFVYDPAEGKEVCVFDTGAGFVPNESHARACMTYSAITQEPGLRVHERKIDLIVDQVKSVDVNAELGLGLSAPKYREHVVQFAMTTAWTGESKLSTVLKKNVLENRPYALRATCELKPRQQPAAEGQKADEQKASE